MIRIIKILGRIRYKAALDRKNRREKEEILHFSLLLFKRNNHLLEKELEEKNEFIKILEAMALHEGNVVFRTRDGIEKVCRVDKEHLRLREIKRIIRPKYTMATFEKGPIEYQPIPTRSYRWTMERDRIGRPIFEEVEQ